MKKYFCINSWISNISYSPNFELAMVQIGEELEFNVGDRIFLGPNMFEKLHKAAIEYIKKEYKTEEVKFGNIFDLMRRLDNLNYLSIMFSDDDFLPSEYTSEGKSESFKRFMKKHPEEQVYSKDQERENFKFFCDELYDIVEFRISDVSYDLGGNKKVFSLNIENFDY